LNVMFAALPAPRWKPALVEPDVDMVDCVLPLTVTVLRQDIRLKKNALLVPLLAVSKTASKCQRAERVGVARGVRDRAAVQTGSRSIGRRCRCRRCCRPPG